MSATCHTCRASSADGSAMACEREGCPGEAARADADQLRRHERAHDHGAFDHPGDDLERPEEIERGRDFDRPAGVL